MFHWQLATDYWQLLRNSAKGWATTAWTAQEKGRPPVLGEALATAATNAAALLGMEDRLGAVAPGYYADLVSVEGDPLADINVVIQHVRWVMKNGKVVVDRRSAAAN